MSRYLFVTGKLAAESLGACLAQLPDLAYDIATLPISVAALMDTSFVAKHLANADGYDCIVLPGLCTGDLDRVVQRTGAEVISGPKNLKDIPAFFGAAAGSTGYGEYRIKILAEIVGAYKMSFDEILARASYYKSSGADIIDIGCAPDRPFKGIGRTVAALKKAGHAVSVDSFNSEDILEADKAGADLVLSVNSRNIDLVPKLKGKVVVIPDPECGLQSLESNIARLESYGASYIIDPILKPILFGFAESMEAFVQTRRRYPESEMMLGLGNITELTDADSAGINALMAGFVTELGIEYVLTTEVISWACGAVREFDCARRLMFHAQKNRMVPKHLNDDLIIVKDPPFEPFSEAELRQMQTSTRDHHYRIFAGPDCIYVFNRDTFIKGKDVQILFENLKISDAAHAFYLGQELQKAALALKLGKRYTQDQELRWGYLWK